MALQQARLAFQPISAAAAAEQRCAMAEAHRREHPHVVPVAAAEPKRGPGRPPLKRPLQLGSNTGADAPDSKRAYRYWFDSPYMNDILREYRRQNGSAKRTLAALRKAAPDERYASLSDSTIRSWFNEDHQLLPRFQMQLDAGESAKRGGRPKPLDDKVEQHIKSVLQQLRDAGTPLSSHVIRWVMQSVFTDHDPSLLGRLKLSQQWISQWVRQQMGWTWRACTSEASKLPMDWEEQGIVMAKRVAATMGRHDIHPSLVINMDQTGVHLVPAASWTYAARGEKTVAIIGAEDKRQITACIASSLHGDMLPLQLIFAGKTARCLPDATDASKAARMHLTFSDNHWSSLGTMKQWVSELLLPYRERCIEQFQLRSDAHVLLLLDVWAVHKSEEFRMFLRTHHPRVHLVFVPARCTSKLQVADVALQRPFKSSVRRAFNAWAAREMHEQIRSDNVVGLRGCFGMATLKPLVMSWCLHSWQQLQQNKGLIANGWYRCVSALYDVHSPEKRLAALAAAANAELDPTHVPADEEQPEPDDVAESEHESDTEQDELDLTLPVPEPTRSQPARARQQPQSFGFRLDPTRISLTEDSS